MDISTGDWIALGGAFVAFLAFVVAAIQFRAAARAARAQFLLDMDQAFEADNAIRTELSKTDNFNPSPEQWRLVKAYMCRFERHESLRPDGNDLPARPDRGSLMEDRGDEGDALGAAA